MTGIPDDGSLEDQLKWRRFADCEETLLESAQTADTIIRLVAGGNAGSDGRGTVDGRP